MISSKIIEYNELTKEINITCPQCNTINKVNIPEKIIEKTKQLTTVSIPSGYMCQHTFQLFIDKDFKIRGYQKVDYSISQIEFLGSGNNQKSALISTPLFQDIINLLRDSLDWELLGVGLFTIDGMVLYSSLPQRALFNTIREFEIRDEKNLFSIKKLFLHLENDQKVCSQYMKLYGFKFIVSLLFSPDVKLGLGSMILTKLIKKLEKLV